MRKRKQRVFNITDTLEELEVDIRDHELFRFASLAQMHTAGLMVLLQVLNGRESLARAGFEFKLADEA